jgi:hypothetical protein
MTYRAYYNRLVTPKGLEPSTNRTGICHSIQLNYGAGTAAKIGKIVNRES